MPISRSAVERSEIAKSAIDPVLTNAVWFHIQAGLPVETILHELVQRVAAIAGMHDLRKFTDAERDAIWEDYAQTFEHGYMQGRNGMLVGKGEMFQSRGASGH